LVSPPDFTDWSASPEDQFQRAEVRAAVTAALEGVPAGERAVFELRDMQGLSFEETAEVLGITEGAARVRLHRVRQHLMIELEQRLGTKRVRT
jgi:RNA polymerase sigma-70 factor (ECF subfamily)